MLKGIGLGPSQVCILSCKDSWVKKNFINISHLFIYWFYKNDISMDGQF